MEKMISMFKANPNLKNAQKVQAHNRKHPFARLGLVGEEVTLYDTAMNFPTK